MARSTGTKQWGAIRDARLNTKFLVRFCIDRCVLNPAILCVISTLVPNERNGNPPLRRSAKGRREKVRERKEVTENSAVLSLATRLNLDEADKVRCDEDDDDSSSECVYSIRQDEEDELHCYEMMLHGGHS